MGRIQPGCLGRFRHVCMGLLIVVSYALGQSSPQPTFPSNPSSEAQGGITSRLFTLSRLGPEHLANAAYRKGAEGTPALWPGATAFSSGSGEEWGDAGSLSAAGRLAV